jgi:hypothetical protein
VQYEQLDEFAAEYWPAGQVEQVETPARAYWPAGQFLPGVASDVHDPVFPPDVCPAGQSVHAAAPSLENVLAGHVEQSFTHKYHHP